MRRQKLSSNWSSNIKSLARSIVVDAFNYTRVFLFVLFTNMHHQEYLQTSILTRNLTIKHTQNQSINKVNLHCRPNASRVEGSITKYTWFINQSSYYNNYITTSYWYLHLIY